MNALRVLIMAGPNGSGKTSVIEALQDEFPAGDQQPLLADLIINPDIIRKLPETLEREQYLAYATEHGLHIQSRHSGI